VNAQNVQQAAEERLRNGLATLPDVLEARSATAQAKYDLQAVLGAEVSREAIWQLRWEGRPQRGFACNHSAKYRRQNLSQTPWKRRLIALAQRPDLQAQVAAVRLGQAERQQARAGFYPSLSLLAPARAHSRSISSSRICPGAILPP
jgi:outer membrane protein